MRRKIDEKLLDWARAKDARPLLLHGARRVGKTYAVKHLGEMLFPGESVYCDFQTDLERFERVFSSATDVTRIVNDLSLLLRTTIVEGRTLIIFDEIQLCEKALNSLRFFAQTNYRVIATGSQLGVAMRSRKLPFPSDVEHMMLRPLDFEEFLIAMGEEQMAQGIRRSFCERRPFILHDEALSWYRQYCVVGGMPRVVDEYHLLKDFAAVRTYQAEIDQTYAADIALYASTGSSVQARAIWSSVPMQLARETTRKFKYADVARGARERTYREPLAWLEAAGLVTLNYQTNDYAAPLVARGKGSFFKVYLADTGIMYYKLNLAPEAFIGDSLRKVLSPNFRGALAENYCMQALCANEIETFYWTPGTTSHNEVEFVLQNRMGGIIPLEVKSGNHVSSASFNAYRKKCGAEVGVRISSKNFGFENGVLSVPLYAVFCIDEKSLAALS